MNIKDETQQAIIRSLSQIALSAAEAGDKRISELQKELSNKEIKEKN